MKAQGTLEDLTPAGGIVAIIAGILILVMAIPALPSGSPQLDYIIEGGFALLLIMAGLVAIVKFLTK